MYTDFYIFRHGETDNNLKRIWQGSQLNPPLNAKGRQQARQIIPCIADYRLEILYASPLRRAAETAEIANSIANLPIIIKPDLRECNFGAAEGLTFEQLQLQFPDLLPQITYPNQQNWHLSFPGHGSESKQAVSERFIKTLLQIAQGKERRIGIFSHCGAMSAVLCRLSVFNRPIPNCGILHIRYEHETEQFKFIA